MIIGITDHTMLVINYIHYSTAEFITKIQYGILEGKPYMAG